MCNVVMKERGYAIIKHAITKGMSEHMQPEIIVLIDDILLITNGKVDCGILEKKAEKL